MAQSYNNTQTQTWGRSKKTEGILARNKLLLRYLSTPEMPLMTPMLARKPTSAWLIFYWMKKAFSIRTGWRLTIPLISIMQYSQEPKLWPLLRLWGHSEISQKTHPKTINRLPPNLKNTIGLKRNSHWGESCLATAWVNRMLFSRRVIDGILPT